MKHFCVLKDEGQLGILVEVDGLSLENRAPRSLPKGACGGWKRSGSAYWTRVKGPYAQNITHALRGAGLELPYMGADFDDEDGSIWL